jgi:AcrR family transcriptional regulator
MAAPTDPVVPAAALGVEAAASGAGVAAPTEPTEPTVLERILVAGLAVAESTGLTRLSMGAVAKQAGVSRQTVYKYFASKEALIAAVVEHEAATLIAAVVTAAQGHEEPAAAMEAALVAALRGARDHPLLDRLLRTEPEVLLPLLTGRDSTVMAQVREITRMVIGLRLPDLDPAELARFADIVTRLLISFAINPPEEEPEALAAAVAAFLTLGTTDPT